MKRVAVFGNAGAGKSTLSKRLAEVTGLPLIVLDAPENGRLWVYANDDLAFYENNRGYIELEITPI